MPDRLIDAHHHLWNPASNDPDVGYVWLKNIGAMKPFGDPTPIQRDYLLDEFKAEPLQTGLVASVHVQCDGAIPDPVAETRFIQSISDESNFPIAIVAFVDLEKDDAAETIGRHVKAGNVAGIRQILSLLDDRPDLSFAAKHYFRSPSWQQNFALLEEFGLSFDLQLYPEQMAEAADFISDFQNISVIIDHAGSPYDNTPQGFVSWQKGIRLLAELPNISAKISGLGMYDLHSKGSRDASPIIEHLCECFGASRILFGSNFPVDKLMTTYAASMQQLSHFLIQTERTGWMDAIFHDNTKRIYRL